jgi:outer membrane protein OmpA-like peptidoglycan-associated protein
MGALDVSKIGFNDDSAVLVAQLRAAGQLPALAAGWSVKWEGLGTVSGAQAVAARGPVLPRAIRETLQSYYTMIFAAGGATSIEFDDAPLAAVPPNGAAAMPVIYIPEVRAVTGSIGETETTIPNELLGFTGDSALLPSRAGDVLDPLVADIKAKLAQRPDATVTITAYVADAPGPTNGQALSQARADACAVYLVAAGVTNPIKAVGGGTPRGEAAIQNGQFSEALAAGMRRARITY